MDCLPAELLVIIINYPFLAVKDVIELLSTCQTIYQLTNYWRIRKRVFVNENDIFNKHYHNLTNILINTQPRLYPRKLIRLAFEEDFNEQINKPFPSSIRYLMFGDQFNQSLIGCLPKGLKVLHFGDHFNQPIVGCFFENLRSLYFGSYFNQPIVGCFFKELKVLCFGRDFNQWMVVFLKV